MVNKQKEKGTRWERDAVALLNKSFPNVWKRIPGSGAIGTILDMPILKGDLVGKYTFIPFKFVAEAKVGYGGSQMTIKKEWFDKIREEATQQFAIPLVLLKFENSRSGVKHIVAMDTDVWNKLLEHIQDLQEKVDQYYEKGYK